MRIKRAAAAAAAGVSSIAKSGDSPITGAVTLTAGTNITLTEVGQDITIDASGGGAVASVTGASDQIVVAPTTGATVVSLANPTLKDSGSSAAAWEERSNNTPAQTRWGTEEQSAGGAIFTGSSPNAGVFGTVGAHVVQWFYNNVLKATLNATALNLASGVKFQQNGTDLTLTTDPRLSDARTPTAHATSHNSGGGDVLAIDAVVGTGSLRTLGTGAQQAAVGTHTTPTMTASVAGHVPTPPNNTTTFLRGDATFNAVAYGSLSGTPSTFAPTAHASSHTTGTDKIASGTPDGTKFLRDDFAWAAPVAATPDLIVTRMDTNGVQSVASGYSAMVLDHYTIGPTDSLTIGATAVFEIGR
jgi:hypothetical protein